jgi:alkaline phosphatase
MGLDAMTAAAYHGGALAMRDLPVRGMMATHAADRIVGDEASTATAIATGRRTKRGYVGVGPDGGDLQSALERGAAREMRTGIVTDGSVTGETLGAFYNGSDEAAPTQEALSKDLERVDVVLGPGDDSLASMTREAIRRLSQDGKPFFLVVESDKIGKLQRSMNRDAAVPEAVRDFDRAVRAGIDFARDDGETLVVALGDRDYSLTVLDDHYAFPDGACQAAQRCGGPYKMSEVGVDARGLDGVEGFDDRDLQGDYAPPTLLMQYGWAEQEAAFQAEDGSVQGPATANFTPLFAGGPGASRLAGMIDQPAVGQFLVDWASK